MDGHLGATLHVAAVTPTERPPRVCVPQPLQFKAAVTAVEAVAREGETRRDGL